MANKERESQNTSTFGRACNIINILEPVALVDVQGFGRCEVIDTDGSRVQVRGGDGFKFWIHGRLVQVAKTGIFQPPTAKNTGSVPS